MSAERKRLLLALAVLFALNIFIIALAQSASADLYKKGSRGDTVSEIQTRLKNWGYYSGAVVLNRVEHPSFPNSISGVIYQPGAFSCLDDGQFDQPVAESAWRAAQEALNGYDPSYGAIYYFNPATATSRWIWSRPLIVVIGSHRFCS